MEKLNKLEERIIDCLDDDIKAPYEVAKELRMKRKSQLLKLKDAINLLYTKEIIDTVQMNGEKKIYVKQM